LSQLESTRNATSGAPASRLATSVRLVFRQLAELDARLCNLLRR